MCLHVFMSVILSSLIVTHMRGLVYMLYLKLHFIIFPLQFSSTLYHFFRIPLSLGLTLRFCAFTTLEPQILNYIINSKIKKFNMGVQGAAPP